MDDEIEEEEKNENEFLMELEAARQVMLEQQKQNKQTSQQTFIYNKEGMLAKMEEVGLAALPWPETMEVGEVDLNLEDVHDDLAREMAFYQNILAGVKIGRAKLKEANIPYQRPEDFFAEMIKSDAHMDKIKDKLIFEKKKMEAFEARKQREEQRQFSKAVGAERQKEKAAAKKDTLERVAQWRKRNKERSGGVIADDDDLDDVLSGKGRKPGKKSFKRQQADKKFGHGGPNRLKKKADKKSLNDFRDFNKGAFKNRGKRNQGANRPGKAARAKKRNAKKK